MEGMIPFVQPHPDLYICSRSSLWEGKPCDEAIQVLTRRVEGWNFDDPKKLPFNHGTDGGWYTKGTNHRVVDGRIRRDMGYRSEWGVWMKDLQGFIDKYGDCVVGRRFDGFLFIEIYDDYRE